MNSQEIKIVSFALVIILLLLGAGYFFFMATPGEGIGGEVVTNTPVKGQGKTGGNTSGQNTGSPEGNPSDQGAGSSTEPTTLYVNDKYKFSFYYPVSWRVVDGDLAASPVSFYNFPSSDGEQLGKGKSKIDLVIVTDPQQFFTYGTIIETRISGQKAFIYKVGDGSYYSYAIVLPSEPGKYLAINMHGDPARYPVLDELLKSLTWK